MSDLLLDDVETPRAVRGRSLWEDARRRLMRNPSAVVSLYVVAILVLIAIFGPMLWVHPMDAIYRDRVAIGPTFAHLHLLGTDTEGRDLVARTMFGLRISLLVGVAATVVALTIGVTYGAVAGFFGGVIDEVMMRIVDVLYSIPFIFFVIVLMTVINTPDPFAKLMLIFMAIGAVEWLTMARIVRGQTIALRNKEFVEAARAAGARPMEIVFRHIVPNVLGPVVVFATLNVPVIILLGELPLLHRPWRAGAADLARAADFGRLGPDDQRAVDADHAGRRDADHAAGAQLPRRRPARRARSEGSVSATPTRRTRIAGPPASTCIRKLPIMARRMRTSPPLRALRGFSSSICSHCWPLSSVNVACPLRS